MKQERICVGIDVSSEKLDVSVLDARGRPLRPYFTVANDHDGWKELKDSIVKAAHEHGDGVQAVCGMESTGIFHKCLERELRRESRLALEVHVINPRVIKSFSNVLLQDAKTDKIDSGLIARYLHCMRPEPGIELDEGFEEFREATRTRRRYIEERTLHKNRLHKLLRLHLPGYRTQLGKEITKQLLVTIREMPSPDEILARSIEAITTLETGIKHHVTRDFAERLRALAERAPRRSLHPSTRIMLRTTARHILEIDASIAELDVALEAMSGELYPDHHLRSIPGIGPVSTAAILAEVGDIRRFATVNDFIGYCGLYPMVWESGKAKRRYSMTRNGNRMLKMTFLVASASARRSNPVVAAFYNRLLGRGKSERAAGGASARKLAQLVYAILRKNEVWSDTTARRGMAIAEEMSAQAT